MHIELEKWVQEKPGILFWGFVVLHVVVWTLLPSLVNANLPLDVIEGLSWGHAWQWGYHKHPPMEAWAMEAAALVSGRGDWAQYLLSQIWLGVAFGAMWGLAKDFLRPSLAFVSVLLLEGIYYHNYTSPEFNANVSQLPFWAMTIFLVWRGLNRDKAYGAWIGAGVCIGLGFLSKYSFLFLALAILAMLISVRSFRFCLKTPGPWLAAFAALVVVLPHLHWAMDNDFITIHYGMARVGASLGFFGNHLLYPLKFLVGQSMILLPSLILVVLLKNGEVYSNRHLKQNEKSVFLLFIALGPPLIMVALAAIFGWKLRSMWGTPFFLVSGVALVYFFQHRMNLSKINRFAVAWGGFFCLGLIAYAGVALVGPAFTGRVKKTNFPGEALAQAVSQQWETRFDGPVGTVIGSFWYAGNIAYQIPNRPSVYIDADPRKSPWVDLSSIRQNGAVVVAETRSEAYSLVPGGMPPVVEIGLVSIPYDTWVTSPPLNLFILFVPPST